MTVEAGQLVVEAGADRDAGRLKGEASGKRRALGKGLESLLPKVQTRGDEPQQARGKSAARDQAPALANAAADERAGASAGEGRAFEIAMGRIDRNPYQTRTHFDDALLEELAASIRAVGVIQPVLVREVGGGRYQLIAGERRWMASQRAGKETIPAVVAVMNDTQAMEATIVENLQRADLNPIEQARAFDRLGREFRMTQDQMSVRTGKDRASISNFLRLLRLPEELQGLVAAGTLTFGHARALLALESEEQMLRAAQKMTALAMSVRQAETFVKGIIDPERRHSAADGMGKTAEQKDANVREMEKTLRESLGLRVTIEDKRGRGRVVIEYGDLEMFDSLTERLLGLGS